MVRKQPRYPVYVISKGRADIATTPDYLAADSVEHVICVEPQEEAAYRKRFGSAVRVLPFSNLGQGGIPARNWCWEDSIRRGFDHHWILDDNLRHFVRRNRGMRYTIAANLALSIMEEFCDRYTNIAIAGPEYETFGFGPRIPPFELNTHVYSCLLIKNCLPFRWRGRYNEDTDLCLQALSHGWCTVSFNAVLCIKAATMSMRGGNTDVLYKGHGRLKMARSLERMWPRIAKTVIKYGRPQHHVRGNWAPFGKKGPVLQLKPGISLDELKNQSWEPFIRQVKVDNRYTRTRNRRSSDSGA
jgi:hypothetical protein